MRCVFVSSEMVCPRESRGMLLRRAVHSHRRLMERKRQEGSWKYSGNNISADRIRCSEGRLCDHKSPPPRYGALQGKPSHQPALGEHLGVQVVAAPAKTSKSQPATGNWDTQPADDTKTYLRRTGRACERRLKSGEGALLANLDKKT